VLEPLLSVEFLFAHGEDEGRAAIAASQGPVLKGQFFNSSGFSPNENRKQRRGHGGWLPA
jgi:hypothetical protein